MFRDEMKHLQLHHGEINDDESVQFYCLKHKHEKKCVELTIEWWKILGWYVGRRSNMAQKSMCEIWSDRPTEFRQFVK